MKTATVLVSFLLVFILVSESFSQSKDPKVRSSGKMYSQEADLSDKNLIFIPEDVFLAGDLRILDLSNNELTSLPSGIENLKNLRILDIRGNDIYDLPEELSKLKFLREIHLDYDFWHSNLKEIKMLTKARIVLSKD